MTAVDFPTPAPGGSPFDMIRRTRPDGSEYWSARDLMPLIGYTRWDRVPDVIDRAKASASAAGHDTETLFRASSEKSGGRPREDFHLARFACYLVAMNGDPRKPAVAAAAMIPLLQDIAARRRTKREQQWLTETKDHQS